MKNHRFDELLREAFAFHASMVRHYNGIRTASTLFRKAAYRFATKILEIEETSHNEFLNYFGNDPAAYQQWMDEHFDPIEQLGDNRRDLLRSIKEGMTEKQYLEHGRLWGPSRRAAAPRNPAHVDPEAAKAVTDGMTDAEKAEYYRTLCQAQATEITQLRHDLAVVRDELDRMKTTVDRVERIMQSRKRKTAE